MTRQNSATDQTLPTKYMVAPSASEGVFTTIAEAITQAVADGASTANPLNIYLKAGTYVENPVMQPGINLLGLDPEFCPLDQNTGFAAINTGSVTIRGSFTFTGFTSNTSSCKIGNIIISSPVGDTFTFPNGVNNGASIFIFNCQILTDTGATFAAPNNGGTPVATNIFLQNCVLRDSTFLSGSTLFAMNNGTIAILANDCSFFYTSTQSTGSGLIQFVSTGCNLTNVYINSTASALNKKYIFLAFDCKQQGSQATWHTATTLNVAAPAEVIYFNSTIGGNIPTASLNTPAFTICSFGQATDTIQILNTIIFGIPTFTGGNYIKNGVDFLAAASPLAVQNKFITNYAGSDAFTIQAGVQTTNATATVLSSVVVNDSESITLQGTISAGTSDKVTTVGGNFVATVQRTAGGNVALVGVPALNVFTTGLATFAVTADIGSQTIRILVTGIALTTINWVTNFTYQKILTNS